MCIRDRCKLILVCSEGTKFAGLIDEMVEIEVEGTHAYQEVLRKLGRPSPHIDPSLEHILITGMFHTFFELIIHEMPLKDAENYVREMRAFYTAGDVYKRQIFTIPLWGSKNREIRLARVVFPPPDGPTKATVCRCV